MARADSVSKWRYGQSTNAVLPLQARDGHCGACATQQLPGGPPSVSDAVRHDDTWLAYFFCERQAWRRHRKRRFPSTENTWHFPLPYYLLVGTSERTTPYHPFYLLDTTHYPHALPRTAHTRFCPGKHTSRHTRGCRTGTVEGTTAGSTGPGFFPPPVVVEVQALPALWTGRTYAT